MMSDDIYAVEGKRYTSQKKIGLYRTSGTASDWSVKSLSSLLAILIYTAAGWSEGQVRVHSLYTFNIQFSPLKANMLQGKSSLRYYCLLQDLL